MCGRLWKCLPFCVFVEADLFACSVSIRSFFGSARRVQAARITPLLAFPMYLYEVRMRRIIDRRSDQRCAAIRSALAQRAKRSQQSHRLCEVSTAAHTTL